MSKIREVLRLRWQLKLTVREVARGVSVSVGVAQKIASRASGAELTWDAVEQLDDVVLEERLYGRATVPGDDRPRPDPVYIHRELRRTGVTLELLHLEYLEQHPNGRKRSRR
jgi:transposase